MAPGARVAAADLSARETSWTFIRHLRADSGTVEDVGDVREIRSAASRRRVEARHPRPASVPTREITLVAEPTAPRVARHWVMQTIARAGVLGASNQVVELLTGEVVANAVVHGPDRGQIRVRLDLVGDVVQVSVSDECPQRPHVRHPQLTDPDGRGMVLVAALSSAWGVDRRGATGKTVWFSVGPDGP